MHPASTNSADGQDLASLTLRGSSSTCSMGQRVAVTGTTATATENIGGVTLHRFLKLSKDFDSSLDPSDELWPALKFIDAVVIDEISMATAHLLAGMDNVLRRAALLDKNRVPLGGKKSLLLAISASSPMRLHVFSR